MPHVSRFKFPKSEMDRLSNRIVDAALLLRNKTELTHFFDDLLTSTEKIMLGKRLLVAMFLERGYTYREVGRALRVGEMTIALISEKLQHRGEGFRTALRKLEKEEKIEKIFESLNRLNILPSKTGPGRWRFLRS